MGRPCERPAPGGGGLGYPIRWRSWYETTRYPIMRGTAFREMGDLLLVLGRLVPGGASAHEK
jgi:hypothetical protein